MRWRCRRVNTPGQVVYLSHVVTVKVVEDMVVVKGGPSQTVGVVVFGFRVTSARIESEEGTGNKNKSR